MLTMLGLIAVVLVPPASVAGLLLLATRAERGRAALAARQIAVTDAIHRELGAVVAPVARRRSWRTWELSIAVPFECPDLAGAVTAVAHRALARFDAAAARDVHIVLVPARVPACTFHAGRPAVS